MYYGGGGVSNLDFWKMLLTFGVWSSVSNDGDKDDDITINIIVKAGGENQEIEKVIYQTINETNGKTIITLTRNINERYVVVSASVIVDGTPFNSPVIQNTTREVTIITKKVTKSIAGQISFNKYS